MKNQFPIRILIMGAVTTSSALHANPSTNDDGYWNVQWNADPGLQKQKKGSQNTQNNKTETNSPQFFPLEAPEVTQPPKVTAPPHEDDDWGLESFKPQDEKIIAQAETPAQPAPQPRAPEPLPVQPTQETPQEQPQSPKTILINFNNVSIGEYIRFISRISGKNFIFDEKDLDFNVTVVSEGPTTIQNVMITLLQELRAHGFNMMEEGNTIMIYKNDDVRNVSKVSINDVPPPRSSRQ